MMNHVPMGVFLSNVGRAMLNRMDLSPYFGQTYFCACGGVHSLSMFDQVLFQGFFKIVLPCPDDDTYLTLLKVKMFSFRRNSSLVYKSGTRIESELDKALLGTYVRSLR